MLRGAYSFVACLSHLTIDHASLSRRSTVPTPSRDTSNIWELITLLPHATWEMFAYPIPVLFRHLRPPWRRRRQRGNFWGLFGSGSGSLAQVTPVLFCGGLNFCAVIT